MAIGIGKINPNSACLLTGWLAYKNLNLVSGQANLVAFGYFE